MQVDDYLKAGKIAAQVRENVRKKNWVGSTVAEICEEVEGEIQRLGAKCAFPVVTNGSQAYATLPDNENEPIDQIFGIDFPP